MRYGEEKLFPVRCFTFEASDMLIADTLAKVRKLEFFAFNEPAGVGTTKDIQHNSDFHRLHKWMQGCVDDLKENEGWMCDRLLINKTWANRADARSGHHHDPHRHPMSYISGILYLTDGPPTTFCDPLQQRDMNQLHLDGGADERLVHYHGGSGGLILFPSWLIHYSEPNFTATDRYTISFNTFPDGILGVKDWEDDCRGEVSCRAWNT